MRRSWSCISRLFDRPHLAIPVYTLFSVRIIYTKVQVSCGALHGQTIPCSAFQRFFIKFLYIEKFAHSFVSTVTLGRGDVLDDRAQGSLSLHAVSPITPTGRLNFLPTMNVLTDSLE